MSSRFPSPPALAFPAANQWSLRLEDREFVLTLPTAHLDGHFVPIAWATPPTASREPSVPGIEAWTWSAPVAGEPGLHLDLHVRVPADNPVVRFRYTLRSDRPRRLTNREGCNALTYLAASAAGQPRVTEVRFSVFSHPLHSFTLCESAVPPAHFENGLTPMGPMLVASDGIHSTFLAYEHGSQWPNAFVQFRLAPDRSVAIEAVKGNYFDGRVIGPDAPFETIWFHAAVVAGDEGELAAAYRDFILRHQSPNAASRKPWIFYNTWNYQERAKHWQRRAYLADMNAERMLAEIDVAHRMGVEVFVIDTGWYSRTGDWEVDRSRFPAGLGPIKAALDARGMQLGLWFNPTIAALSSRMWREHQDGIQEWRGVPHPPHAHWEGEPSQGLCLVSRYAEAYADEMIRLVREVGVTYFKWDAIGQDGEYSCDAPGHDHGGAEHSAEERNACYGFEQVRAMTRVIDKVCAACPEAIFDFDITEGGRSVGLAFLASGKYFLINNGPYHANYDLPPPADGNANLFFFPGPARGWICRAPLDYDRWIPSVLFLTHYFPDGPADAQTISAASLMLGQNGIWGDLLALEDGDITRWRTLLDLYKQVRDAVTAADPVRAGRTGDDFETHEKIAADGRGLVAIFGSTPGSLDYVTEARSVAAPVAGTEGVEILRLDAKGRAVIRATFTAPGARLVFFGAKA